MRQIVLIIAFQIFTYTICFAQYPHITGTVRLSITKGIIECDLKVSNIPEIGGYSILLNAGLNVNYFRDSSDSNNYYYERYYNDKISYEAFQYYFPNNDNTQRFLPKNFRINYIGAFPVINDTLRMSNGEDWKGNIAFNNKYLRATEQSAWYPILYDTLNDVVHDKVTYDLKIICEDEENIYINGSLPIKDSVAILNSNIPSELLIFVGNYKFIKKDETWFVNTFLDDKEQNVLCNWSNKIINFYENKLKIPYGYSVIFMGAEPVSKSQNWMFVTYPTIVVIGRYPYNIKGYFNQKTHEIKDSSIIEFYAHEFGHYYFGTYFNPNAELKWMFLEGISEYISLQATHEILGKKYYNESIQNYIEQIRDSDILPLNLVKESDIDETYRYNYIPLLLTTLENEIGEKKVWNWLNFVLNSKNVKTNYDFFKSSLLKSGVTQDEFNRFEETYIISPNSKSNVLNKVQESTFQN